MNKQPIAAQCWYASEDYAEIKAAMEDGHRLPGAYAHWLEGAEQREEQARRNGAVPVRVPFDLAEFRRFCAHFRVAVDTNARQKFAAIKAAQAHSDSSSH